eukprot:8681518-Alexandrium_andersonii.AAC.1
MSRAPNPQSSNPHFAQSLAIGARLASNLELWLLELTTPILRPPSLALCMPSTPEALRGPTHGLLASRPRPRATPSISRPPPAGRAARTR